MKTLIVWLLLSTTQAGDMHVQRAVFVTEQACQHYMAVTTTAHTNRRCVQSFVVVPSEQVAGK